MDLRQKLLSHGQMLEVSHFPHYQTNSSIDSKPTQIKSPTQTLPGPILNERTNSYFEPRNVNK